MSWSERLDLWSGGWRGLAFAAAVAFLAGLPGLLAMPVLDRDEARFAQATAQMLETGDFVVIRFQEDPRFKKPVGIHWLQSASVASLSTVEARAIWAYRIPSLLGAMLAAAACVWGGRALFDARTAMISGALLGASLLLSTEAFIAKTDAALAGATVLAMAALARLYAARRGGAPARRGTVWVFWAALAAGILIKGPITPMVVGLTVLALLIIERRGDWLADLKPTWGLILIAAVAGPWAGAVTVATDGGFWTEAIGADLAPKLAGAQESHGAPPGYHLLLTPILAFPMTLLLPAALVGAWRHRGEAGVRFAVCWLIPTFLVFELSPTKLPHYTLPAYAALAWLAARALVEPIGRPCRYSGAALSALIGLVLAGACIYLAASYGDPGDVWSVTLAAGLFVGAGLIPAWLLLRKVEGAATSVALGLAVLAHGSLAALVVPGLEPLRVSSRLEAALEAARLLPRQGVAEAPVAVVGYAEPSLVFALGTTTELHGAEEAVAALAEGRPAIVEAAEAEPFQAALAEAGVRVREVARVDGLNYSKGDPVTLGIYMAAGREDGR